MPTSKSPHAKATNTMNALAVLILSLHATTAFVTSAGPHSRSTTAAGIHSAKAAISTGRADTSRMLASTGTGFFESLFGGQKTKEKKNSGETARLSEELFDFLTAEGAKPDDVAVMEKIEELEAAPGVSFNKDYLYDGPWRVLWKTNTAWQRYFDPLKSVADNRAYQWYKEDGSVTNIAQALGDKLYVTVDGQGSPASTDTDLPYEVVNVEVSRAWLHALGGKIPLDFIKGKGTTFVVYNDARLRIFRSDTGGVVVQTKADEVVPV
ncbi:unnamed protein product [Ectocarpus sp. 12 AP-2014]